LNRKAYLHLYQWIQSYIHNQSLQISLQNNLPDIPEIDDLSNGIEGIDYEYSFVSIDKDEDKLSCSILW
jgi:hypothetical protein